MPAVATTNIVQTAGAASTTLNPVSLVVNFAATQVGTDLFLIAVVCGSASPGITTPTNWTLVRSATLASGTIAMYRLNNNVGGLTSVAIPVTGTIGGIAGIILEISDTGSLQEASGVAADIAATNTCASSVKSTGQAVYFGELAILGLAFLSTASLSVSPSTQGWTKQGATQTSTTGSTNVSLAVYIAFAGASFQSFTFTCTLTGAVDNYALIERVIPANASAWIIAPVQTQQASGSGYSGAVGGL